MLETKQLVHYEDVSMHEAQPLSHITHEPDIRMNPSLQLNLIIINNNKNFILLPIAINILWTVTRFARAMAIFA